MCARYRRRVAEPRQDVADELARLRERFPVFAEVWDRTDADTRDRFVTWMSMPRWRTERRWRVRHVVASAMKTGVLRRADETGSARPK